MIRFFVGGFRLSLVLLLAIVSASAVAAIAAIPDPGIPDTVKFGTAVVSAVSQDKTVRIRIWYSFDETNVQSISIPLRWSSPDVYVDLDSGNVDMEEYGVDFSIGIGKAGGIKGLTHDIPNQRAFIYSVRTAGFFSSSVMAENIFCEFFMKVPAGTATQSVTIDTVFFPPSNSVLIVDGSGEFWTPQVVTGRIEIVRDIDNDGVPDAVDNCPTVYNPDQANNDSDGLGNTCDNCPLVSNEGQSDADHDSTGDACDICTDTDRDGFGNPGYAANTCPTDNCPNIANADQKDTDGDGLGDECDACTDSDGDGYGDPGFFRNTCPKDNCPYAYNPAQEDADHDGKGDACDVGAVDFTASPRCGSAPLTVTFTDQSVPIGTITSWHWDFGDSHTSTQQNPTHEYDDIGVFDVMLIISDGSLKDTLIRAGYVTTQEGITAEFIGLPTSGRSPLTVMFEPTLQGVANEYRWYFGDGDSSALPNPIHTYASQGRYDVTLIARLIIEDDCDQVDTVIKDDYVIVQDLQPAFSANPTAGYKPLLVQFTDESAGNPSSWYWDFGDGETSAEKNPVHQYLNDGRYDVFLRVTNAEGTDSLTKLSYIHVASAHADLCGEIWPVGARPGFNLWYYCIWTNTGTEAAENCTLKVLLPSQMSFSTVYVGDIRTGAYTGFHFAGDTLVIPLGTIMPSSWYGGYVIPYGVLPETVPLGDTLVACVWLTGTTPEQDYTNNQMCNIQEVTGSIDPNDKVAYPGGQELTCKVKPEERLGYIVQFENKPEATAEAIYVRVVDTLDPDLDWSTLAIGDMSHPNDCTWKFDPYTGVITWFCDSIMLPRNVNAPEGEGYFTYSVSPKPGLPDGTEIVNSAWIRFDYNAWMHAPEEGPLVRTIQSPCNCAGFCDVNIDGFTNPIDVVIMVNYVYKSIDTRQQIVGCPAATSPNKNGDWNCDGAVNPVDVVRYVNFVYKGQTNFPPCGPCNCTAYPPVAPGDCPPWPQTGR